MFDYELRTIEDENP